MKSSLKNSAIVVFGSGVGGLTILKEVKKELPNENIIYFADSANCPYGAKGREEIASLSVKVIESLIPLDIKMVIVACNTATTNAIATLREHFPEIIFVGTEPAVKPALIGTKCGVIGVLATLSTLKSHQIEYLSKRYGGEDKEVVEIAGEGLVEFIEESKEGSEECRDLLKKYLEPMIERGVDYIALGCTHYPFLIKEINDIIGDRDIKIVEPAMAIARQAKNMLVESDLLSEREGDGELIFKSSCSGSNYINRLKEKFSRWQQI